MVHSQTLDPRLDEFFRINRYFLNPIGGWPFSSSKTVETLKLCLGHTHNIMSVIVAYAEIVELVEHLDNIFSTVEGICVSTTAFLCIAKNLPLIFQRKFLRDIFMSFNDLYVEMPVPDSTEQIKTINAKAKQQAQFLSKGLCTMYMMPLTFYMCYPWWRLYNNGELDFPFPSKFPYDTSTMQTYLPPYFLEFVMGYGLIFIFAGLDTMFSSMIIFLCSRIEVLEYSAQMATNAAIEHGRTTPMFGSCVVYHTKVLRACQNIEQLYSPLLVLQFLFSTVTICMLCFLSTQTTLDNEKNVVYLSYFICMIFQLYIYNYFGQLIQNKCTTLSESSFASSWYHAPVAYQKDFRFYLLRCRKPFIFTAYKCMPVNLETFYAIIKTSVSYYTMLVSMKDDE